MTAQPLEQDQASEDTDTGEPLGEQQDWYFTFGSGQRMFIGHNPGDVGPSEGLHLMGYYVVIHGTFASARERMVKVLGIIWSSQYSELPDMPPGFEWKKLADLSETRPESRL